MGKKERILREVEIEENGLNESSKIERYERNVKNEL